MVKPLSNLLEKNYDDQIPYSFNSCPGFGQCNGVFESKSVGLGGDFLEEYERTITRICKFPEAWAPVSPNQRRCLMRRFPYAVFYSRVGGEIIITGVADLRVDPEKIQKMLLR